MLHANKALLRCQELMPELDLDLQKIDANTVAIKTVDFKKWEKIFAKTMAYCQALQEKVDEFPDVEPFFGLSEAMEDLGALITSLYIFYDCTLKTYRIEPRGDN